MLKNKPIDLAYQFAKQRVKSANGLTRPQRLAAAREALAKVMGGDPSRLGEAALLVLAKQAPEEAKQAAFRGMKKGETDGVISQKSAAKVK